MVSVRHILSWMVADDWPNYTRFGSLHWCEMLALEQNHPDVYQPLLNGEFCLQRCSTSTFSQVPVDQAVGQTVNKHTKRKGGIIGFSKKPSAVQRWIINAPQGANITRNMLAMAGMEDSADDVHVHKEGNPKRRAKDEKAVQAVVSLILGWKNPFTCAEDEPMSNISSGLVAPSPVSKDLLSAFSIGEQHLQRFIQERLVSCTVPFHDPLSALKLKTFTELMKTKSVKVKGKDVVVRADRGFYSRLLVIAQSRSMDLRQVFQYSLGAVPWALATLDGQLARTAK